MAIKYKNKLEIAEKELVILPRLPPKLRTPEVGVTEEVPLWWPEGCKGWRAGNDDTMIRQQKGS
jgi:hypothetical protein